MILRKRLEEAHVDRISMQEQSKYKYILNIEGNSAAYRLSYLLSLGCVILNVKSENKLWWEKLWVNNNMTDEGDSTIGEYIEIEHDLSNLAKVIQWCNDNPKACEQIAKNSKEFYKKYITRDGVFDYLDT